MAAKKKSKSASKASKASKKSPRPKTSKAAKKPTKTPAGSGKQSGSGRKGSNATIILHALVGVLAQRKLVDPDNYPAPLGDLLEEAGHPRTTAVQVTKARTLRKHLTLTVPTSARSDAAQGALVGFAEDAERIVTRPELLVGLLKEMRKPKSQLFTLVQLATKLFTADKKAFEIHWREAIGERELPQGVGALRDKGKLLLFFLNDVVQAPPDAASDEPPVTVVSSRPPPSTPVRDRLLEAFDELDVAGGRRNYVTLFDLRNRLPDVGRDGFDAAVNELRREWILTLDPAEGRHERLPEEVLAAGIMDQSSLMVYAARRDA